MSIDVLDILRIALLESGMKGLVNPNAGCGCGINDLSPGGCLCDGCCPAMQVYIPDGFSSELAEYELDGTGINYVLPEKYWDWREEIAIFLNKETNQ